MAERNHKQRAALKLLLDGNSVIPIINKKPLIKWKEFQERLPLEDELRKWQEQWPDADIAVVCGKVSGGLTVIDIDDLEMAKLIKTWEIFKKGKVVETPSGGLHLYFLNTSHTSKTAPLSTMGDFKAEGSYVVCPPSDGYRILTDMPPFRTDKVREIADKLLTIWGKGGVTDVSAQGQGSGTATGDRIESGTRQTRLTSIAGSLRHRGLDQRSIEAALVSINERSCCPPLPLAEITGISKSVMRYPAGVLKPWGGDIEDKKNPNDIATEIQNENDLLFLEGRFYRYRGGVFRPVHDIQIKKLIKQKLGASSNIKRLEEVLEALSIDCHTFEEPPEEGIYLNLKNGMLELETCNLIDHSPEFRSIFQLPVNFKKGEKCPLFEGVVSDWLDGDKEKVRLLQEFLGYCLTPRTNLEKMLFLLGGGANGKTTLIRVIEKVFGKENCSAVGLDQLPQRFAPASLRGKLVNLTSESPSKGELNEDVVKRIVTGDTFQTEEKYKDPFNFRPTCKLIVACNDMPRTKDRSSAIYRRLLFLNFNKAYSEEASDKTLDQKLAAEKDGIFLWCLRGLLRLRWRDRFIEPKESALERENYQRENNSAIGFAEECCRLEADASITVSKLYFGYIKHCRGSGLYPFSKPKFGKEIKRLFKMEQALRDYAGGRARVWVGIDLTECFKQSLNEIDWEGGQRSQIPDERMDMDG